MHSYSQDCPLHYFLKDILYTQAQRGQAQVELSKMDEVQGAQVK